MWRTGAMVCLLTAPRVLWSVRESGHWMTTAVQLAHVNQWLLSRVWSAVDLSHACSAVFSRSFSIIRTYNNVYFIDNFLRCFSFFFQSTAQLQYVEDSEPVTRSTWPLLNSARTEMQVQEEMDKRGFHPRLLVVGARLPTPKRWRTRIWSIEKSNP